MTSLPRALTSAIVMLRWTVGSINDLISDCSTLVPKLARADISFGLLQPLGLSLVRDSNTSDSGHKNGEQ